jgi:catechol 2,3-dioxygenase-like lactoylglutathione lyase family enzyme
MTMREPLITGVDFVSVPTRSFDAAVHFYETVLSLPCTARYGRLPGAEFETGNLTLAVYESEAFGVEFHPNKHGIALHVEDVEAARAELESRGVSFQGETMDTGVCHKAFFEDPDGNALELHHRYAPRSPHG